MQSFRIRHEKGLIGGTYYMYSLKYTHSYRVEVSKDNEKISFKIVQSVKSIHQYFRFFGKELSLSLF